MRLKELYDFIVQKGIDNDPRGKDAVTKDLQRIKKNYQGLSAEAKRYFDQERLVNPYNDTRVINGDGKKPIKTALVGIDIEVGELLLADRLSASRKNRIDLVIAHHPEGTPYANLYQVMRIQSDILHNAGLPINVAEGLMSPRICEVERRLMPANHMRAADAAGLLDIAFMCAHTPADNAVTTYLQKLFLKGKPDILAEVLKMLQDVPEYKLARQESAGPKIILGKDSNRVGKIFVDMTGGTEGSKDVFERLSQAGIGTMVCMHLSEDHFKQAEKEHINVIIAGHISSDNLGMNLLIDEITKHASIEIIACSGFRRVKR